MVDLFDAKVVCLNGFCKIQEFCTFQLFVFLNPMYSAEHILKQSQNASLLPLSRRNLEIFFSPVTDIAGYDL